MSDRCAHSLDPLLRPASIALLGASERPGSVGFEAWQNLTRGGFSGALYPVNPSREAVFGTRCYASLADLPESVEHVLFAVADSRVEAALDDCIAHGARAATIYSTLILDDDTTPNLRTRVQRKLQQSGLLLCGANGMGFYNFHDGVWACGFDTRPNHRRGGNVTLISHSGSGMSGIIDCEERIDFNLAVSTGQELAVTMDQYMDYAIECMDTRVIGLFMETARNPAGLRAVLAKAARRGIPVVALKVGRTELAARLTVSHSGAMAGQDEAFQALFDRYGVQRVEDMDELATALIMFAQPHPVADGGVVSLHDSGGERQLMIDLADRLGVPLTEISAATRKTLKSLLDPGLEAVNPLDAWSRGGPDYHRVMEQCMAALMRDQGAAFGAVVHDRAPLGGIYTDYIGYLRAGHAASGKPAFLVANRQGTGQDPLVEHTTRDGFPVLDGLRSFLTGARCLLAYRDFQQRDEPVPAIPDEFPAMAERWRERLAAASGTAAGNALDEHTAACLLADFGLPVNPSVPAGNLAELARAADQLAATHPGGRWVLKSAQAGLLHKTEQQGVLLDLDGADALQAAYQDLSQRLGPEVLLAPMVHGGVEMVLGLVHDQQFGPLVLLGFGGIEVESRRDIACALPPFSPSTARRLVDSLQQRHRLDASRGRPALDIDAYCAAASRLSQLAIVMSEDLAEIDINPVLVQPQGCIALDALVVAGSHSHCGQGRAANPAESVSARHATQNSDNPPAATAGGTRRKTP